MKGVKENVSVIMLYFWIFCTYLTIVIDYFPYTFSIYRCSITIQNLVY